MDSSPITVELKCSLKPGDTSEELEITAKATAVPIANFL